MKTKHFGFYFLVLNLLIFMSFSYWVITPKWYHKIGHKFFLYEDLPQSKQYSDETRKNYLEYKEKMKKSMNSDEVLL